MPLLTITGTMSLGACIIKLVMAVINIVKCSTQK